MIPPIAIITQVQLLLPLLAYTKSNFEICSSAECISATGQDDYFHAGIAVQGGEGPFELLGHGGGEGIAFVGPVESDDDDGGWGWGVGWVVGEFDVGCWVGFVGWGEGDGHDDSKLGC